VVPAYRETLNLRPDRPEESGSSTCRDYLGITRSSVAHLRVDVQTLKALSIRVLSFPYCSDDNRWSQAVADVVNDLETRMFQAAVIADVAYSIIPSDLISMDGASLRRVMSIEHGDLTGLRVASTPIHSWDAQCCALIPDGMLEAIPACTVLPENACWIPSLLRSAVPVHAHVNVAERSVNIAVLKGKQCVLMNAYDIHSAEDVLYFLMAALEQLTILHTEVRVTLYGEVKDEDSVHSLLKRYISHLTFAERPAELSYSYSFKEVPNHQLHTLLNAPLCAS